MQDSAQHHAPGSMVARVLRREDPKSVKAVRFEGISGEASRDSPSLSGSAVIAPAATQAVGQDATRGMPAKELHQAARPPAKKQGVGWEFLEKHYAKPILLAMLEALPKEVDEAGEENERSTEKAGILLLSYILPELDLMCVGTSRFAVPSWESKVQSMMNLLVNRGGKVGSANNRARLFLRDFVEFLAVKHDIAVGSDLFPIGTEEVREMVEWLRLKEPPVIQAIDRVPLAVAYLAKIGCRVSVDVDKLAMDPAAKVPTGGPSSTARACPPPMMVYLEEAWARNTPKEADGHCVIPSGDYACHNVFMMRSVERGEGYIDSRFLSRDEVAQLGVEGIDDFDVLVCREDKRGRRDVLYFIPRMSLVFPGTCAWSAGFAAAYSAVLSARYLRLL
jgi:hypothetical protein